MYEGTLRQWQEKVARKAHLTAKRRELLTQREALSARTEKLKEKKLAEQADVDRLEGGGLTAFFYNALGKMDEKLDREREEAYAAKAKYDAAARELYGATEELERCEQELASLDGCEEAYRAALEQRAKELRALGTEAAQELLDLESRIAAEENMRRELDEAIDAGESALETIGKVMECLEAAEGWGEFDVFGGGLLSNIAKHSNLDEAQAHIEQLQSDLRRLQTELVDVKIDADIQVGIDGFLGFADFFFDGLFADLAVLEKIKESTARVQGTKSKIESVLSYLKGLREKNAELLASLHKEMETLLVKSEQ